VVALGVVSVCVAVLAVGWLLTAPSCPRVVVCLLQAWGKPLAAAASMAPLCHSCMRVLRASTPGSSSGSGSNSACGVELQLLVVQGDAWRLLLCREFSSATGMPQQWVQAAMQQQAPPRALALLPGSQQQQHTAQPTGMRGGSGRDRAAPRVRFAQHLPGDSTASSDASASADSMCDSSSGSDIGCESDTSACSITSSVTEQPVQRRSILAGSSGGRGSSSGSSRPQRPEEQQQPQWLLGGTLLQPAHAAAACKQQRQQPAVVAVWTHHGEQQLWSVLAHAAPQPDLQQRQQQQQQQQKQQVALQASEWPAPHGVLAAADAGGTLYALLCQQHLQDIASGSSWWPHVQQLLPHKHAGRWAMHMFGAVTQGPAPAMAVGSSAAPQQQQWLLQEARGSWNAAWARQFWGSGSSRFGSGCAVGVDSSSSGGGAASLMVLDEQQADAVSVSDQAEGTCTSGRKRPAADQPAAAAQATALRRSSSSSNNSHATDMPCGRQGPAPGVAKQARVAAAQGSGSPLSTALPLLAAVQGCQQQQVGCCGGPVGRGACSRHTTHWPCVSPKPCMPAPHPSRACMCAHATIAGDAAAAGGQRRPGRAAAGSDAVVRRHLVL
jgi:hypothetical protein